MTRIDSDADIAEAIFGLLDRRGGDATICTSEVARTMHPEESTWRAAMPRIREVAGALASRGLLRVTRRGQQVDATRKGGPIRLGRAPRKGTHMNEITVTAFRWVPPFVQGFVRDLRVRWALEEAGMPYGERLIGAQEQASADYRALQPFGQVPAFEEDGLVMFESGAIVMHIAERSAALMPADAAGRAGVQAWMFAALNTIEPPLTMLNIIDFQPGGAQEGEKALRRRVLQHIDRRLGELAASLGDRPYLVAGHFSAADLLMATVLRTLDPPDRLTTRPLLDAYLARCLARPAYLRALAAQMAAFAANTPAGQG